MALQAAEWLGSSVLYRVSAALRLLSHDATLHPHVPDLAAVCLAVRGSVHRNTLVRTDADAAFHAILPSLSPGQEAFAPSQFGKGKQHEMCSRVFQPKSVRAEECSSRRVFQPKRV